MRMGIVAGAFAAAIIGTGLSAAAASAQAASDTSTPPVCSIRTLDFASIDASCMPRSPAFEYRVTILCGPGLSIGSGRHLVDSGWRPTSEAIRLACDPGGRIEALFGPMIRQRGGEVANPSPK